MKVLKKILPKIWYWIRWPLAVLVVFYFFISLFNLSALGEKERNEAAKSQVQ